MKSKQGRIKLPTSKKAGQLHARTDDSLAPRSSRIKQSQLDHLRGGPETDCPPASLSRKS